MQLFEPFVAEVQAILSNHPNCMLDDDQSSASDILDAGASRALSNLVPMELRRENGVFFTSKHLASIVWKRAMSSLTERSVIVDPACGAGDLLLPPVRYLVQQKKSGKLNEMIRAADIQKSFAEAARKRLQLTALVESRGSDDLRFDNVLHRDFLECSSELLSGATHIVLNPPFTSISVMKESSWGNAKVNAAAVFVDLCLRDMDIGARLVAILPDVLRSGSRYERWRRSIVDRSTECRVTVLGQFDRQTDVHVFLLELEKSRIDDLVSHERSGLYPWQNSMSNAGPLTPNISSLFDIMVGSVVPHRDIQNGPDVPFVTAKNLPSWVTVTRVTSTRKYTGRLDQGPLVIVRRTSRPGERYRARATLITDPAPLAIENHLISLIPKDKSIVTCEKLMRVLRHSATTEYLDARIRCRHLTVGSVGSLPWLDI